MRPTGALLPPGGPAPSGASAAALHGFALHQQDLSVVHLLRLDEGSSRRRARTNHHVVTQDVTQNLVERDGLTAVAPARAVWEVACRSSLEAGVVTADSPSGMTPP